MTTIPETLRICAACGEVARGESCESCERMGDLYDALYHAHRAAQIFGSQPREMAPEGPEPLTGLLRGLISALQIYALLFGAALCVAMVRRWLR